MALFGIGLEDFGGLDLTDAVNENGGAIDMLNVDLDVRGRMRARDGFSKFTTSAAASPLLGLTPLPTIVANGQIIGPMVNGKVEAVNATSGALVASTATATTMTTMNLVAFGDSSQIPKCYGPSGEAGGGMLKWDGAAFSTVAIGSTSYTGGLYANVSPVDNRLMILNLSKLSVNSFPSAVWFSDPGAPEAGAITNFVNLVPGDGEAIRGVCNFANQVFVFKETKFFVFTGTSTDAGGNPIFNYRMVNTGIGAHPIAAGGCCAAAPDGVYFFGKDGIYKTTGGAPQKISGAVDPLFGVGGPLPPYFQGQAVSYTSGNRAFMAFYKNRIYVTYDGASARGMLVYDIPTQQWMYWNVAANGLCANPISGALTFSYQGTTTPTSTDDLGAFSTSATTDAGTNITGRYRSAYLDFDGAGRSFTGQRHGVEKTIRESIVDGMGTVNYRLMKQWVQPANLPTAASLTLGTSPQVQQSRDRRAVRARSFSWQIDGTAPWTIEKLTMNMRDIAAPTLQRTGV